MPRKGYGERRSMQVGGRKLFDESAAAQLADRLAQLEKRRFKLSFSDLSD